VNAVVCYWPDAAMPCALGDAVRLRRAADGAWIPACETHASDAEARHLRPPGEWLLPLPDTEEGLSE